MSEYRYGDFRVEVDRGDDFTIVSVYQWLDACGLPSDDDFEEAGEYFVGQRKFGSWVDVPEMLTAALVDGDILDEESAAEVVAGMLGGVQNG